jgi:hypothetical protein
LLWRFLFSSRNVEDRSAVECRSPGLTVTPSLAHLTENWPEPPDGVGLTHTFLVTDGDYLTSQQINANGGAFMQSSSVRRRPDPA